jgi:hypothetical protein
VLGTSRLLFGASFVPMRDGVRVEYRGRSVYLTPDDLLHRQAYDCGGGTARLSALSFGVKRDAVLSAAAAELRTNSVRLLAQAKFRRVAMRSRHLEANRRSPTSPTYAGRLSAAGNYLARRSSPMEPFGTRWMRSTARDSWLQLAAACWDYLVSR